MGVWKKVLFKYLQQIALAQCSSRLTWKWGLGKWHVSDDKIHIERTPQSLTHSSDPKNRAKFTILRKEGIYVSKHTSIFAIAIIDPILCVCMYILWHSTQFLALIEHFPTIFRQPRKKRELYRYIKENWQTQFNRLQVDSIFSSKQASERGSINECRGAFTPPHVVIYYLQSRSMQQSYFHMWVIYNYIAPSSSRFE